VALASKVLEAAGWQCRTRMLKILQRNVQSMSALVTKVMGENDNLRTASGVRLGRCNFDLWQRMECMVYDLNPVTGIGST
jgi:two-component system phosphate regulon sensor histidine kinase PhoR